MRKRRLDGEDAPAWTLFRFFKAARTGDSATLGGLLPHVDAAARDQDGRTALMLASAMGNDRCVELLLPVIDAKAPDQDGWSALMRASVDQATTNSERRAHCIELLIPHSDVKAFNDGGSNALMCAARSGFERGVLLLLAHSDLSATNRLGQTAKEVALAHGHLGIAALMAERIQSQENSGARGKRGASSWAVNVAQILGQRPNKMRRG